MIARRLARWGIASHTPFKRKGVSTATSPAFVTAANERPAP